MLFKASIFLCAQNSKSHFPTPALTSPCLYDHQVFDMFFKSIFGTSLQSSLNSHTGFSLCVQFCWHVNIPFIFKLPKYIIIAKVFCLSVSPVFGLFMTPDFSSLNRSSHSIANWLYSASNLYTSFYFKHHYCAYITFVYV